MDISNPATEASIHSWQRLKAVFTRALELEGSAQADYIRCVSLDDHSLGRQLEGLLERQADSGLIVRTGMISQDRVFEYLMAGLRTFEVGDVVAERYSILRFIAEGGMGEVYAAEDLELGGCVAIKTLRPELSAQLQIIEQFKQEIQLARRITHPNVCRVFDMFRHAEPDGRSIAFLTMELLEGETLFARIQRAGPLSLKVASITADQVAAGLDAAHCAGIVHRDLKSGNILLVSDESSFRAVITDFGLALKRGAANADGAVAGTPAYIAPEQLSGGTVAAGADIYAFGTVLFEMLTGRTPFVAATPWATAQARLEGPAPRLRSILKGADADWDRMIAACLEMEPSKRPCTATDAMRRFRRSRRTRRAWVVGAPACIAAAASLVWNRPRHTKPDAIIRLKRAEEFSRRRNAEGLANAISEYKEAIRIDEGYSDAWAGLADAYSTSGNFHFTDPQQSLPLARTAAAHAIQLNPQCARAHGVLAYCMSIDVHDWLKAEPGFIRALAIDANNPQLHLWYGSLLGKFGRAKEAIAQVNAGLGVDPTSLALNTQLAAEYYRARMPAEYYRQALDVVKLFPFEATAHLVLARAYEWAGDWEKGLESCREADKYRVSQAALCLRGSIEAGRRNLGPARAIAENIESYWNTHPFETVLVAALYSRIGDRPKVFALLEAGVARNDGTVLMVPTHPHFDPVRNDSQYRSFLRRIGL